MEDKFEVLKEGTDGMWLSLAKYMVPDSNKRQGYDWFMFPEAIMYFTDKEEYYKTDDLKFHIHLQQGGYKDYSMNPNNKHPDLRWLEASINGNRIRLEMCYAAKIVKDEE